MLASGPLIGSGQSWAAVVTLLILVAGVVAASFRNSYTKRTIESMKEWSTEQDRKIDELTKAGAEKDKVIEGLTQKVQVLQDMVTGHSAIDELARQFADAADVSTKRQAEILSQVGAIRGEVRELHEKMDGQKSATRPPSPKKPRTRAPSPGSGPSASAP